MTHETLPCSDTDYDTLSLSETVKNIPKIILLTVC